MRPGLIGRYLEIRSLEIILELFIIPMVFLAQLFPLSAVKGV